ncbi:MAG: CusA/CzcA family heavy metal efflux RND transporter [Micavibrio aeruginosavorus]|uniref:CusA/CzcA family heavy metal efflux RND transporter n=1 Tax=Micavibrio aeruginosavorus TaxID=349221 RepID=A0A2W5BYM2_9BACT|nr:MAG: CusA/CzcA family heavy metal efflux RND transporter [Micavibrio aeruginosavorus]
MQTDTPHGPSTSFAAKIIDWSVANKFFVMLGALVLLAAGIVSIKNIPLDAIPDLSDTQVIIRTDWPGQAPQIIEDQVTFPLSTRMLSLPRTKAVRAFSMFGDSFIYIVFEDGVDMYWARSRVLEALSQVAGQLPEGVRPQLGPDATGVGWVFQYALVDRTGKHDLQELRSLQDWFVRFELATVKGVAEIASVGGFVKEYQVLIRPLDLENYGIPLPRVIEAVRNANQETGGRTLEMAGTEYMIRSFGYAKSVADLEKVALKAGENGTPVTVGDVARVVEGPAIRRGITELNGEGEAVGGFVVARPGANANTVIQDVKERLESIRQGLPEGVELVTVYDRSQLIEGSVDYLKGKVLEESLMVALVTFIFLLHVRSAGVAIVTLPLGILTAFIIMAAQGITANIMSLGGIAIAIGAMVDASIVMVENAHRKLSNLPADAPKAERQEALLQAAKEVGPGLFFSLLIITVSFLPVFALTGQSHKLFAPLAYTKTYAMAAAALLSVTLVPVLMLWFVRGKIRREDENVINRFFIGLYKPFLNAALIFPKGTLVLALIFMVSTAIPVSRLGSEFMPPLYEGSLLYMPMTVPGASPSTMREILQVTNRQIMTVPEVALAFGKAGRSNSATDPAPLNMIETWVELKPRDQWRSGMTPEKLVAEMNRIVTLPGLRNIWGYPIKIRIDMLTTGIRTPVGIKISGRDLTVIDGLAKDVEQLARQVPGTRSAVADRVQGGKYIEIVPNRDRIARYGIDLASVQAVIQTALGGMQLSEAVEGRERYPIMLRYDRPYRETLNDVEDVLVPSASGASIPLANLADIRIAEGPAMITSEDARLQGWVFVDIEGRDIGSYIGDLQAKLKTMKLPDGYSLKLSGQFEQMQEAKARLSMAIPATLLIILTLLYLHFGRWDRTFLIMMSVPFGVTGGFWCVWLAGYNMSVAVAVGFIALAGIAVETAIVMLIYIDHQMRDHPPADHAALIENIKHGAAQRVRPKLMTVSVIILGLVPIFLTEGPGSDVMRRIALPMIGGMISTTILTLILIPVLYLIYMSNIIKKQTENDMQGLSA